MFHTARDKGVMLLCTCECSLIPQPRFIIKVCKCDYMKVFISHIIFRCCTSLKKADLHVYCIRLNKVILTDFHYYGTFCRSSNTHGYKYMNIM